MEQPQVIWGRKRSIELFLGDEVHGIVKIFTEILVKRGTSENDRKSCLSVSYW